MIITRAEPPWTDGRNGPSRARFAWVLVVFICTLLAAWLRAHRLAEQVLLDDEWHALLKLMSASYAQIAASFGYADHSIPLTLLYKAMAATLGLDEVDMRALQVACGTALVPLAALLAWRASRDAPASALFALLVAVAPFLVLYSRLARPYAITTLLVVAIVALAWRWSEQRSVRLGAAIALLAALSAWLHPLAGLYPATACLFLLVNDAMRGGDDLRARLLGDVVLGVAVAAAMIVPLAPPLINDFASLAAKAGMQHADLHTLLRALAIFVGGLPRGGFALVLVFALAGAALTVKRDRGLGLYLLVLAAVPPVVIMAIGAAWSQQGHTFARYVFPLQVIVLFWASVGALSLFRAGWRRAPPWAAWGFAVALGGWYAAYVPTYAQVRDLGAWYGHLYHHFDYDRRYNRAAQQYDGYAPPDFFVQLGRMPPGAAPVIEAPFSLEAGANPFAYFDEFSRQPAKAGMLSGVCLDPRRRGEIPRGDQRFRFRDFVFLSDPRSVRASGSRFILLHRDQVDGHPFPQSGECIERLTALYGPPVALDARLAVWDLRSQH